LDGGGARKASELKQAKAKSSKGREHGIDKVHKFDKKESKAPNDYKVEHYNAALPPETANHV